MNTQTSDIASRVIATIAGASKLDASEISRETQLDEIGISSLELTEVVMDLEEMFGIEIDLNAAEAWDSLKNVGDIIDTMEGLVANKG